jgi:hypothetical protein
MFRQCYLPNFCILHTEDKREVAVSPLSRLTDHYITDMQFSPFLAYHVQAHATEEVSFNNLPITG